MLVSLERVFSRSQKRRFCALSTASHNGIFTLACTSSWVFDRDLKIPESCRLGMKCEAQQRAPLSLHTLNKGGTMRTLCATPALKKIYARWAEKKVYSERPSVAFEMHSRGKTQDMPSCFDLFGPFFLTAWHCASFLKRWLGPAEGSRYMVIIQPWLFSLGHSSKNSHVVRWVRIIKSAWRLI